MIQLLFVLLLLYARIDNAQQTSDNQTKDKYDWDYLMFTQQWPETVCREWVHHNPSHTCRMPKAADSWSVHGVWPDKIHTRGPEFCNRSWNFDPEQIRPIETELIDTWTNVEGETEKYSFWAHEWSKHGTCAATLEPLNSEFKYFSIGLKWFQKYNMGTMLAKSGIVPDDYKEYSLKDIYNAVKSTVEVEPSIQCRKDGGKTYLVEVRICLDKKFVPCNCDSSVRNKVLLDSEVNIISNCDPTQGILYPHNKWPMKKIYVELYKFISWLQWFTL